MPKFKVDHLTKEQLKEALSDCLYWQAMQLERVKKGVLSTNDAFHQLNGNFLSIKERNKIDPF